MKPSFFLFGLVGTALAGRSIFRKRDLATIQNALNAINTAAGTLDTDVKAFDGSSAAVTLLQSDSAAVLSAINTGNSQIAPTDPISYNDALTVAGTTGTLITTLNQTIADLIAQKPAFDSAGVSSIVLDQLQQQNTAATTFGATVVSKIPSDLQSIAQGLIAQITAAFQQGITAFADATAAPTTSTAPSTPAPTSTSESSTSESSTPPVTSEPTTSSSAPATSAPTSESTTTASPTAPLTSTPTQACPTIPAPPPSSYSSAPASSAPAPPPPGSYSAPAPPPPGSYSAPSQSYAPTGAPGSPQPSQPAGNPWGDIGTCIAKCIAAQQW
ncbi:MAG: hypothetical protein Q9165_006595 [Trypethelium subeluteriae]